MMQFGDNDSVMMQLNNVDISNKVNKYKMLEGL